MEVLVILGRRRGREGEASCVREARSMCLCHAVCNENSVQNVPVSWTKNPTERGAALGYTLHCHAPRLQQRGKMASHQARRENRHTRTVGRARCIQGSVHCGDTADAHRRRYPSPASECNVFVG